MAPAKEGGRNRRKAGAGRAAPAVRKDAGRGGEVAVVDFDPWGAFLEAWMGAAAADDDRHEGGRGPAGKARATGAKPGG